MGEIVADKYRRFQQRVRERAHEQFEQHKRALLASSSAYETPWSAPSLHNPPLETTTTTTVDQHDSSTSPGIVNTLHRLVTQVLDPTTVSHEWRPMTPLERIQRFPLAMKALADNWQLHQYIVDASNSRPMNAWTRGRTRKTSLVRTGDGDVTAETNNHGSSSSAISTESTLSMLLPGSHEFNHGDDNAGGEKKQDVSDTPAAVLPWRQQVQKRQAVEDMSNMAGLALLWIPPIVGWIPTILAVVAPRQAYTRHFHSPYEVVQFAMMEQNQRFDAFDAVLQRLCPGSEHLLESHLKHFFSSDQHDSAGPLLNDPMGLYNTLFEEYSPFHKSRLAGLSCLEELPVSYAQNLALAMGIGQSLPTSFYWKKIVTKILTPIPLLRNILRHALYALVEDDVLLIRDGHHLHNCTSLTNEEVVHCCRMRNLPIATVNGQDDIALGQHVLDYDAMRQSLANHLHSMENVISVVTKQVQAQNPSIRQELRAEMAKERLGLFAAHVSILRYGYNKKKHSTTSPVLSAADGLSTDA